MNLQVINAVRRLVAGVAGGSLLVAALGADPPKAAAPPADPKSKATFSDSDTNEVRVDVVMPGPMLQPKMEAPRRGSSSLEGVGAVPFAPMPGFLPGAMSRRERELREARENWILNPGKGLTMSEENLNRAFGVRTSDVSDATKEANRPSSFWEAYLRKDRDGSAAARPPALQNPAGPDRSAAESSRGSLLPEAPGLDSMMLPFMDRERGRVLFSDSPTRSPGANGVAAGLRDGFDSTRRDLVRDSLNFTAASSSLKQDVRSAERAEQFRRLLGLETSPKAGAPNPLDPNAESKATPGQPADTLGSVDPLALTPDPTRRELNPVVARPAPDSGIGARLTFSDSINGLGRAPLAPRRPLIDMSPMRLPQAASPGVDFSAGSASRRITYSPTALEMPRRSF